MQLKQRVILLGDGNAEFPNSKVEIKRGTIAGMGHYLDDRAMTHPFYVVELDHGFYDPAGNIWVSKIIVDRNSENLSVENPSESG